MFNKRGTINLENNHQQSNQADQSLLRVNEPLKEENLKGLPQNKSINRFSVSKSYICCPALPAFVGSSKRIHLTAVFHGVFPQLSFYTLQGVGKTTCPGAAGDGPFSKRLMWEWSGGRKKPVNFSHSYHLWLWKYFDLLSNVKGSARSRRK